MLESAERIRVLLVDDIPETRENLRKLLYFEKDIEVAGVATNGEEAIELAKELLPDIVLMDINMPGMDGIAASEGISRSVPTAQIIMMSVQGETEYLRRSMLAGAKGFLIKPFLSDEMVTTIRRVYNLRPKMAPAAPSAMFPTGPTMPLPSDRGKILAVFSPKGGVGCSLLASNLAIALRTLTEERVVLVDCSLQFGDLGVLLNLTSDHTMAELASKEDEMDGELLDIILTPHLSGVKVLLAPSRPEEAELLTPDHIREVLGVLREMFGYIVVDMGSSLQDLALTIFDIADRILLIVTPEIPSVKNAKLFFEVTSALGYPEGKTKLILNKADRQSPIGPKEIAGGIKHPVLVSIPSDTRTAYMSVNQGIPCVLNNHNSAISQGITKLAQLLVKELLPTGQTVAAEHRTRKEPGGILSRLLRK